MQKYYFVFTNAPFLPRDCIAVFETEQDAIEYKNEAKAFRAIKVGYWNFGPLPKYHELEEYDNEKQKTEKKELDCRSSLE